MRTTRGSASLFVIPLTLAEANDMIEAIHRHHKKVQGHRFSLGLIDAEGRLVGACTAGRPVARMTDARAVLEVTRLVTDGTDNACSMLYGAAARAGKAMGFERIQTFILAEEPGTSLLASGWLNEGPTDGGHWGRPSRERELAEQPGRKVRWTKALNPPRP